MKKCIRCGLENEEKAKFCEKCGFSYKEAEKIKKNRFWGIFVLALCFLIVVVGGSVFVISSAVSYSGKIDEGFRLIKYNKHREAVTMFDKAIKAKPDKPKGYIGKAEAQAGEVAYDTVPKMVATLREGYEKTGSEEIVEAYISLAEILKGKGYSDKAQSLLYAGFLETGDENLQEKTEDMRKRMAAEYESVVKKYQVEEDPNGVYYLYDVDKDSVPELILSCSGAEKNTRNFDMYTYKIGRATRLEQTLTYPEVQLRSAPGQNGVLFFGKKQTKDKKTYDCADIISIRDGKVVTDGFYTQNEESEEKNESVESAQILPWENFENRKEIALEFAVFEKDADAFQCAVDTLSETCESYALYDVDRNGTTEIIALCKGKTAEKNNLKIGKIYTFNERKLKKLGEINCAELYRAPVGGFCVETAKEAGVSDIRLITYNLRNNQLESEPYLTEDQRKSPVYRVNGKEASKEAYEKEKKNIAFIPTTDASAAVKIS